MPERIEFNWEKCREAREKGLCRRTGLGLYPCQLACKKENRVNLIFETTKGDLYTCVQCPEEHPPCIHYQRYENISFADFLRHPPAKATYAPLCGADALEINGGVKINSHCVGCLLCAAYCPISAIAFDQQLQAHVCTPPICTKACIRACVHGAISLAKAPTPSPKFRAIQASKTSVHLDNKDVLNHLKNIEFEKIKFPRKAIITDEMPKRVNFELFTAGESEVRRLTPWVGNAFRYIYSLPAKFGAYEVRLPEPSDYERYPRLDFCLISPDEGIILISECKRDFYAARSGVIDQISKKYRDRVEKLVIEHNLNRGSNFTSYIPLLVGGEDSELEPKSTNLSFYQNLIKFDITLISTSFVWILLALKLLVKDLPHPQKVFQSLLCREEVKGLLKNGAIIGNKELIKFCDYKTLVEGKKWRRS